MIEKIITTDCCIVGGGPAGMMTGFLLARAGVDVIVLEKHPDFFRDFRGDTIHPSTFELMNELGFLKEFLEIPHQEKQKLQAKYNGQFIHLADFSHLHVAKPAIGFMPQWEFLNFLKTKASIYQNFHLLMNTSFYELITENGVVTGAKAKTLNDTIEIKSKLVIGTDGRHSDVREKARMEVIATGVPIDVLWFRLSKKSNDPVQTLGYFKYGKILIMLDRNDYWQCGYVITKGSLNNLQASGIEILRNELVSVVSFLSDRVAELKDWNQVKLLNVEINHLTKWYREGLLCIGDAAHAMSPVGGVGINLALQDAVATANILWQSLKEQQHIGLKLLKKVQKRRSSPTTVTQRLQVYIQKGIFNSRQQGKNEKNKPPFIMRMINKFPLLQRIPAKLIGMGIRPEHIQTPDSNKV